MSPLIDLLLVASGGIAVAAGLLAVVRRRVPRTPPPFELPPLLAEVDCEKFPDPVCGWIWVLRPDRREASRGHAASFSWFQRDTGDEARSIHARLVVVAALAPPLVISRETIPKKITKKLGLTPEIEVGDRLFDSQFLLETTDGEAARRALKLAIRQRIQHAFERFPLASLTFGQGEIEAVLPLGGASRDVCTALLDVLGEIAGHMSGAAEKVRLLPRSVAPGAAPAILRCGYCHEEFAENSREVLACEVCSTVQHAACWREAARCTVMGCHGRVPVAARFV